MDNSNKKSEIFPRNLTKVEAELLFTVLPENKSGYKIYRDKIINLLVIGYGRFGGNNFILGKKDGIPDLNSSSAPIFATGTVKIDNDEIDVVIHEEIENEIEVDISPKHSDKIPDKINEFNFWSYSEWIPGEKAPNDNSDVREIEIVPDEYILAVASIHKKIWLHEKNTGINYLFPVTNFYNYLMIVKNIRDSKIVLNPALLFKNINDYKDDEIISAFILYNKYFKKINYNFSSSLKEEPIKKKSFLKFFKKDN